MRPHFLALLAEALGKDGQADEGLCVLEDALAMAHSTGEAYYESELYRIKGDLLLCKLHVETFRERQQVEKQRLSLSQPWLHRPKLALSSPSALRSGRGPSPGSCAR